MTNHLLGKSALVIGGSRGIGAAVVKKLAAEGAAVAFTYMNAQEKAQQLAAEIEQNGGKALALKADSADANALIAAVDKAATALGGLDILVNNAGILVTGSLEDYSLEDFDRMFQVNVRGVFVAIKATIPHMRQGGRIVTIGSITEGTARGAGSTVYGMTKAAVARLVKGAAWDLAARGITINDVQPGPTATDMTPAEGALADRLKAASPAQRLGEPQEIANLVAYLAGPQSSYINGSGFVIDGGFSA